VVALGANSVSTADTTAALAVSPTTGTETSSSLHLVWGDAAGSGRLKVIASVACSQSGRVSG
jgi:hypothetical protein